MASTSTYPPIVLSENDRKAIEKSRQKPQNLSHIQLANSTRIDEICQSHNDHDVAPKQKHSTQFLDNFRAPLGFVEYVLVAADFSVGQNWQEGYGFITKVNGCGTSALFTIHFSLCANNQGKTFEKSPFVFSHQKIYKRTSSAVWQSDRGYRGCETLFLNPPIEMDICLPVDKLLNKMVSGSHANKKKG